MVFVYFQRPYVTNAQTSGKIRPNKRNTSKMVMTDNWLVLTKSPKIFIRATIGPLSAIFLKETSKFGPKYIFFYACPKVHKDFIGQNNILSV